MGLEDPQTCLAILATCRQILFEAWYTYYQRNTFNFERGNDLRSFLKSICPSCRHEIVSIYCGFSLGI